MNFLWVWANKNRIVKLVLSQQLQCCMNLKHTLSQSTDGFNASTLNLTQLFILWLGSGWVGWLACWYLNSTLNQPMGLGTRTCNRLVYIVDQVQVGLVGWLKYFEPYVLVLVDYWVTCWCEFLWVCSPDLMQFLISSNSHKALIWWTTMPYSGMLEGFCLFENAR